MILATQLD